MTKEELVDLVLEQVEADEDFAASLDMKKDLDVAGEAGGIATVAGGAVDEAGADDLASLERRAAIVGAGVGIRVESREIMCPSECVEQADAISGRLLELAGDGEYVRVHGDELRRTVRNVQRALDCGVCGVFEDAEYNIEEALNKLG
jgi:hypothetical protein